MYERNEVIFRGSIVSMNVSNKLSTFRIVLDTQGNHYFPNVYVYDSRLLKGFSINDRVFVKGHTQNQDVYHRTTKKTSSQTVFVADEIYKAGRMLCDYINPEMLDGDIYESGKSDDINRVFVCGKVVNFYVQNDNYMRVKIVTTTDGQTRQCDVTCAYRQFQYAKKHLKIGDYAAFIGYAYTNIVEKPDKNKIYYESIFSYDICKIKETQG